MKAARPGILYSPTHHTAPTIKYVCELWCINDKWTSRQPSLVQTVRVFITCQNDPKMRLHNLDKRRALVKIEKL